jgi:hypothetical protein
MENLATTADEKAAKVVLRGVNVDVYKVLKLMKLAPRMPALDGVQLPDGESRIVGALLLHTTFFVIVQAP